jgi:hypothetical protein
LLAAATASAGVSCFTGALTTFFFVVTTAFVDTARFRTTAFFLLAEVAAPALAIPTANASATQAIRE